MKAKFKFKGKAYDKWVEGDLYHDYENTYIREYYTEEGLRVSTKTWHDWVVNPDTVELVDCPGIWMSDKTTKFVLWGMAVFFLILSILNVYFSYHQKYISKE